MYGVVLHAHPVRGESHNKRNTTGEVATRALFCDKFAKLYNDDIRSLFALNLAPC